MHVKLPCLLLAAMFAVATTEAHAAEVKVLVANALKGPFLELAAAFEKESGHKVVPTWGGSEGLAKKVAEGEVADLVIVAAANIEKLTADGKLVAGSRADFAKSEIGVAVRAGLPKPDVSTVDGVKKAVLDAGSIAYSTGPSGFHLAELFKKWGIFEQVKGKVKQPASGVQIGDMLAKGEADLGFQQISELLHVSGISYLGPLPAEIQATTVYPAALLTVAPQPEAAKALVKFLRAPAAGPILKKAGLEPG